MQITVLEIQRNQRRATTLRENGNRQDTHTSHKVQTQKGEETCSARGKDGRTNFTLQSHRDDDDDDETC